MIRKIILLFLLCISVSYANMYFTSPQDFMPPEQKDWALLEQWILSTRDNHIYIYWAGYGGRLSIMEDFTDTLQEAQEEGKVITLIMIGDAYSAQAVSACYANNIENNDIYFLMFHPVADEDGHPMTDPMTINDAKELEQPCIDKGILTVKDENKSLFNTEVYVYYIKGQYVRYYKLDRRL